MNENINREQIIENKEPDSNEPTCEIHFENSRNRVYYTGQTVNGCVTLTINEPVSVKGIYANVIGHGYCGWTTSSGSSKRRTISANTKEEFYINRKIYYVGSQNTSSHIIVQPGVYKYLFSADIPDDCHTSVEENTGFIRYSVVVVIEEDVELKKEFVESFTVINPLNLNDDQTYSNSMNDEFEDTYNKYSCWLCCWQSEPYRIFVKVPKKGYAPGQAIEITINIDNKSNHKFDKFIGNIFKHIEFYANERTTTNKSILTTAECEGCSVGENVSRKLIITVPATPRTEKSSICSISYELTVEAAAYCCREDFKMVFPLTIGSFPILNTQTGGIVVTEQPSVGLLTDQVQDQSVILNETTQPLLARNLSSQQNSLPGTSSASSHGRLNTETPYFRVAESDRSDKDLEKSYKPLYPVYSNDYFPLACDLIIEAGDVKSIIRNT